MNNLLYTFLVGTIISFFLASFKDKTLAKLVGIVTLSMGLIWLGMLMAKYATKG